MKKYTTITKDLSVLISEVKAYLATQNVDGPEYRLNLYHPLGSTAELISNIPSLGNAFDSEQLTISGIGHWRIDNVTRVVPSPISVLVVPLSNTASCKFMVCTSNPNAVTYSDTLTNNPYYYVRDCEVLETIDVVSDSFLVNQGTQYTFENPNLEQAEFLLIAFNEDLSSYFA